MIIRQGNTTLSTIAVLCLALPVARGAESEISRPVDQTITLLDAAGNIHPLQPHVREAARVFVFLTGECPISTSYVPLLNRQWSGWNQENSQVMLYAIWADATTSPADVAKFAKEYEIRFPVLLDRDGELTRRFKPTHVPESFVLNSEGLVAYRGRIDNTYAELGRRRTESTENNLVDAVAAVIEGKSVAKPR